LVMINKLQIFCWIFMFLGIVQGIVAQHIRSLDFATDGANQACPCLCFTNTDMEPLPPKMFFAS
jgi:hypothetical protein